jgi:hypothetical protein
MTRLPAIARSVYSPLLTTKRTNRIENGLKAEKTIERGFLLSHNIPVI